MLTLSYFKRWPMAGDNSFFIPHVKSGSEIITDQDAKREAFTAAYENLLGAAQARESSLNLDFLGMEPTDLRELETFFPRRRCGTQSRNYRLTAPLV